MQLKEGLKEIAFGQWEGKTPEDVNREFHDDYVRWLTDPGGMLPPEDRKASISLGAVHLCSRKLRKPTLQEMSSSFLIRPRPE